MYCEYIKIFVILLLFEFSDFLRGRGRSGQRNLGKFKQNRLNLHTGSAKNQ